jgi:predicted nucleotidyltransferase
VGIQFQSGQAIAGFPALKTRNLLRGVVGATFRQEWLIEKGMKPADASRLIDALLQNELIKTDLDAIGGRDAGPWYKLTEGESVARATGAKRVQRKTAERILSEFMDRVHTVNESPRFLVRVTEVVVFGSYLGDKETLGDLDIARSYENKFLHLDQKAFAEKIQDQFRASGRRSKGLADLFWPWEEVQLFLKNRKRTISLHPISDPEQMIRQSDDFCFEVLLGDREAIISRSKSQ